MSNTYIYLLDVFYVPKSVENVKKNNDNNNTCFNNEDFQTLKLVYSLIELYFLFNTLFKEKLSILWL